MTEGDDELAQISESGERKLCACAFEHPMWTRGLPRCGPVGSTCALAQIEVGSDSGEPSEEIDRCLDECADDADCFVECLGGDYAQMPRGLGLAQI